MIEISSLKSRCPAWGAALWLALVLTWFFFLELPNNRLPGNQPIVRWQIWTIVPELIDFMDPPPEPRGEPIHSGWEYLPQRFDLMAAMAVILAGAWGAGHLALRALRVPLPENSLERVVFAFGIGLSVLSLTTLASGLAGLLSRPVLVILVVLYFSAELLVRLLPRLSGRGGDKETRSHGEHPSAVEPPPAFSVSPPLHVSVSDQSRHGRGTASSRAPSFLTPGHWLVLATLLPFLMAMFLAALLPSTDFDVNEYHFQGPKEFFQRGRVKFLEHNVYTSFPFGTEMLTLLAMVLRDDWYRGALAGKGVLMSFGPLTGLALFAAGRRWFGTTAGVLAAVLYLSTPWIFRISTIAYAEGGLCFYLLTALVALMIAFEQRSTGQSGAAIAGSATQVTRPPLAGKGQGGGASPGMPGLPTSAPALPHQPSGTPESSWRSAHVRLFALAGLLAGSGMACKYPGLVSIVLPLTAAAIWNVATCRGKSLWIAPAVFTAGAALVIGPWLIKNSVETGNPVYPLAYSIFGGRDWDAALDARWQKAHSPPHYALASLGGLALDVALRNDWVNPLLFAFAPLALVAGTTRRRAAWLWLYVGWLFLSCWLFTHRIDRFWVPLLPVAALLAGGGAAWWWDAMKAGFTGLAPISRRSSGRSWVVKLDLLLGLGLAVVPFAGLGLFNLEFIVGPRGFCGYNDFLRELGEAERNVEQLTAPEITWMNRNLPPGSKVLSVGDAALFEARIPVVYNTVFDRSIFEQWLATRPDAPAGESELRDGSAIRAKLADEGITHLYVSWREILRYRSPGNYGYTDFVTPQRFAELQRLGILGRPLAVPSGMRDVDSLDSSSRTELERWGQALLISLNDRQEFVTFQVFPVNGE
jgi:4-amino-4-deoxy-L-arabinose transferase-like glycosyltransferase